MYEWARKKFFHGFYLRFVIESYLEILINIFIHINQMHWETNNDRFSSLFICLFTPLYMGFPLAIAIFLSRRFYDLQINPALYTKFEALVASTKSTYRAASLYIFLFLFRHLIFPISLVFLTDWPLLQVNLPFFQSLCPILYLIA
jgi:hypothetical protein